MPFEHTAQRRDTRGILQNDSIICLVHRSCISPCVCVWMFFSSSFPAFDQSFNRCYDGPRMLVSTLTLHDVYILRCLPIHVFPHRGLWSFYKIMELPLIISFSTIVSIMMISKWIKWQSLVYGFLFFGLIFRPPHKANVRRKFVINLSVFFAVFKIKWKITTTIKSTVFFNRFETMIMLKEKEMHFFLGRRALPLSLKLLQAILNISYTFLLSNID